MTTATRDLYHASVKLPKIHTSYQITVSRPSASPLSTSTRPSAMPVGTSRELPMPTVTRITSLGQAQATLQHCSTKLSKSWQNNPARNSPPGSPLDASDKRHFQQWLDQWEQAFTAYLSYAMPTMKGDEISRSRILKANHLSCAILASDRGPHPSAYQVFDAEFQAIVELAGAVVQSRPQKSDRSSTESPTEAGPASSSLDVREPLYVVVARCDRASTRNQALELLRRISAR
ncbi:hypothetical protein M409DRAFT_63365 [Zasmidium cellare ATCC 36951]|uniref:Uncharacterized protein n=1 Tax=Zasmidium cellare ATCC 36951 TaxID=1080233 RepID=A0A6A6D0U7_ZASCE|nr:uncharacterized protein M409DRAFT_63365 [Zasmidium cellare ATCC 36951]KAF2171782.1 hypothetical protein M409DRAFT_63365 [Zasmidium cellare ATCC 36951]